MKLENKKYLAEWSVDGKVLKRAQLDYGEEAYFRAISSVENLYGMGDHAATQENYALFDYLEYVPYDYSMKPIIEGQLPPEPEGTTVKWDFEEAGFVPVGWTNNGGTIADGSLNLSNGNNFVYSPEVGAGKYTWEIDVPLVGVGENGWQVVISLQLTLKKGHSLCLFSRVLKMIVRLVRFLLFQVRCWYVVIRKLWEFTVYLLIRVNTL